MKTRPSLAAAEAQRVAARAKLFGALDKVKARLTPGALADEAMNGIADRATHIAGKRPITFLAAAGVLGLIVARRQITRWIAHRHKRRDATPAKKSR